MTTGNKIMWKREEIAPNEQFLLFSTLFYRIYISNFRSQITYSFVQCVVQFIVFLTLSTLICRGTDISKYFSEPLGIRDNESRLYLSLSANRIIGYYRMYQWSANNAQIQINPMHAQRLVRKFALH